MAFLEGRFFTGAMTDKRFEADGISRYFRKIIGSGVLDLGTNLQVTAGPGLTVSVNYGDAMIDGYMFRIRDNGTGLYSLPVVSGTRRDRVIIRKDTTEVKVYIKQGASTMPPNLENTGDVVEISLAQLAVTATTVSVTDERVLSPTPSIVGLQAYPVGSVYTTTSENSPSSSLGGTWVSLGLQESIDMKGDPLPVTDPNVVLLLHCDGQNTTAPITDETGKVVNLVGNPYVSDRVKFGTGSVYFDGIDDKLEVTSNDFIFSVGTLEFWAYLSTYTTTNGVMLFSAGTGSTHGFCQYYNNVFGYYAPGIVNKGNFGKPSLNAWHHFAIVLDGTYVYCFTDGVQITKVPYAGNIFDVPLFRIGGYSDNDYCMSGYVDEINAVNGVAKWTANFIPPSIAYFTSPDYVFNIYRWIRTA